MHFSIVIATYNRAAHAQGHAGEPGAPANGAPWEVSSSTTTRPTTHAVVEAAARSFPVPLRYAFEGEQGRSAALNRGFHIADGEIIVTTDDDVRVEPDWLDHIEFGLATKQCDYVGGRVLPIWESKPPRWIPRTNGRMWAVIALLDYGPDALRFGARVPLGVNMAIRREAIERVGGFDTQIGRKAGTLLGQEVREWCLRATAAGLVGYYVPAMVVQHLIPRDSAREGLLPPLVLLARDQPRDDVRADRQGHGGSRAIALDFSRVAHVAGVPRYLFATPSRRFATSSRRPSTATTSTPSSASCGCGCSPASSLSAGKTAPSPRRQMRRCGRRPEGSRGERR